MRSQPNAPVPTSTVADRSLYRPFFVAGIAAVLTIGASWGLWLLWQIGASGRFTGASILQVNAHGHAQVFGWVGLFVMGFGYQMVPALWQRRLRAPRLVPLVFGAMVAGVGIRTVAMTGGGGAPAMAAVMFGGALEILAIAAFVVQLGLTARASLAPRQPYLRFVGAALAFFLVQAVLCLWHTTQTMTAASKEALIWQVATYQPVLRDLQIHGFVLFMVLGVSMRILPPFYGVPEVTGRRARRAWALLGGGVLGEVLLFVLYRFTGRHALAAALLVPWSMLAAGAWLIATAFRPWRPFPKPDRSAKFVRTAYLWLAISLALLLLLPVYQALLHLKFSHAYYGSIRHAITVGFASQMIMGIAARVVPDLRRRGHATLPALLGPFVLVNAGCFLRVTLQALTDVHPAFFAVVGVSGVLELAALALWGAHLVRLMLARPAGAPAPAPAA
jgi:NnrS protein